MERQIKRRRDETKDNGKVTIIMVAYSLRSTEGKQNQRWLLSNYRLEFVAEQKLDCQRRLFFWEKSHQW